MCDGNHDCPQTNKSSGGEDEDNCEVSADGNKSPLVAYTPSSNSSSNILIQVLQIPQKSASQHNPVKLVM